MSRWLLVALVLAGAAVGFSAGPVSAQDDDLAALGGTIAVDGSSTLGPLTAAVAERFADAAPGVRITVDAVGTGRGFERFCAGETDIQDASRPMSDEEADACEKAGIQHLAFEVARDGITLVVNENATFINCVNLDALRLIWRADEPAKRWSDLNPRWPAEPIAPYAPGSDSGTLEVFADAVLDGGPLRADALPAEDDAILVEGVANEENGIAFLGYAWYDDNRDSLNAVAVDGGKGCVEPSAESIRTGTYSPLSRPLAMYVNEASLSRPEVREFLRFYLEAAPEAANDAGFVAAAPEALDRASAALEGAIAGTPVAGTSEGQDGPDGDREDG